MRLTLKASFLTVPLVVAAAFVFAPQAAAQAVAEPRPTPKTTTGHPSRADEEVRRSAQAFWSRRQAKDLAGMYEFYSASYRARVSRDAFLQQTRLVRFDLSNATISRVDVTGERATVTVAYQLRLPTLSIEPVMSSYIETWIREGRDWRKLDEPLEVPFPREMSAGPAAVPVKAGEPGESGDAR